MTYNVIFIITLMVVTPMMILSFLIGRFIERLQWNKLIEKGIVPKPKNKK